jgi:hypothetical protein
MSGLGRLRADGLDAGDEGLAAAAQGAAGGVGEDQRMGGPQQRLVFGQLMRVVEPVVQSSLVDGLPQRALIVLVLADAGLDDEPAHDLGASLPLDAVLRDVDDRADRLLAQAGEDQPLPRRGLLGHV